MTTHTQADLTMMRIPASLGLGVLVIALLPALLTFPEQWNLTLVIGAGLAFHAYVSIKAPGMADTSVRVMTRVMVIAGIIGIISSTVGFFQLAASVFTPDSASLLIPFAGIGLFIAGVMTICTGLVYLSELRSLRGRL